MKEPIINAVLIPEDATLDQIADHVYETAASKGWHDGPPRDIGIAAALLHSEVSEMFEEHRSGRTPTETYYSVKSTETHLVIGANEAYPAGAEGLALALSGTKPEGQGSELADVIIRALDIARENGIDIAYMIRLKDAYNQTRTRRHGGKTV